MGLNIKQKRNWFGKLEWKWNLTGKNNRVILPMSEGYNNHADMVHNIKLCHETLGEEIKRRGL